ncbi:MAG: GDSL-type esterase/lipase family protein [Bacteroidia bacterium]|nr:GDSL-type esterase/lipase family protein [Bacteroidia bacterium]
MHKFLYLLLLSTWACTPSSSETESQATADAQPEQVQEIDSTLIRFEAEVLKFEQSDKVKRPVKGVCLFTGSSSVRLWRDLEGDVKPLPVINRGFGGSTFRELNHYFDRLVVPYRPKLVVVYEGDNDLVDGQTSPEEILAQLDLFRRQADDKIPYAKLFMLAIKPSPSRRVLLDKVEETNALFRAYCDTSERVTYLDIFSPMMLPDGRIDGSLFGGDSLHMNDKGYQVWADVIVEPLLEAYAK